MPNKFWPFPVSSIQQQFFPRKNYNEEKTCDHENSSYVVLTVVQAEEYSTAPPSHGSSNPPPSSF